MRLRTIGLALVAVFAMSAVAASAASAVPPSWGACAAGTPETKPPCLNSSEKLVELTSALAVKSKGTLSLTDTKVPLVGSVTVKCTGTDAGTIGPEKADSITEIYETSGSKKIKCTSSQCTGTPEAEAVHLPWTTELVEVTNKKGEKEIRDLIKNSGAGVPGWAVKCTILGVTKTDECTAASSTKTTNTASGNVAAEFEKESPKANCSLGGTGSGEVNGTDTIEHPTSGTGATGIGVL